MQVLVLDWRRTGNVEYDRPRKNFEAKNLEQSASMARVAVIGTGLVGRAWAISFARAGHEVAPQAALLEEAFRLVADGYVGSEDVDIGIRDGLALRWSFMGPFETIDLNAPGGVRDYVERYNGMFEQLFSQMQRRADWKATCSTGSRMSAAPSAAPEARRTRTVARPPPDGARRP
jgi:3-hydroxyacyl-CoA dehydrogenase